jgi:hypothetical protein
VLTRRALNRALLARQHLLTRSTAGVLPVLTHLFGLQAQAPMPPYYALCARLATYDPEDVSRLIVDRAVVRATTMRGTIHMLTAADYRLVRPMLQPVLDRLLVVNRTVDGLDLAAVTAAGAALLDRTPMTAKDLGAALAATWPGYEPAALAATVSWREPLVQVPPRGLWGRSGPPAFTTARAWLGSPAGAGDTAGDTAGDSAGDSAGGTRDGAGPAGGSGDPAEVVRRDRAAYGPASVRDLQAWLGRTRLAPIVTAIRDELVVFRDEAGVELFDLPDAPRPDEREPAPVRLLADFDTILMGHADRTRIITDAQRRRVFTINGQIRSTFTVDGFVHGIWRLDANTVTFLPFAPVPPKAAKALTAEAERLVTVMKGTTPAVVFAEPDPV